MPGPQKFHRFHNFDDCTEWQLFRLVQPLFASNLPWDYHRTKNLTNANAAAEAAQFDNQIRFLKSDIEALPELLPEKTLSDPEFSNCRDALRDLLCFFEKIANRQIPPIDTIDGSYHAATGSWKWGEGLYGSANQILYWISPNRKNFGIKSLLTQAFDSIVQVAAKTLSQTTKATHTSSFSSTESETPEYPNLTALAAWVQRHKDRDLVGFCQHFLHLTHDIEIFQSGVNCVQHVKSKFKSTSIPEPTSGGREITITNWENFKPQELSHHLYCLLERRTCKLGHEAQLQLDGFLLDSLAQPIKLDVFLSSCPPSTPVVWLPGRYSSSTTYLLKSNGNGLEELDLCSLFGRSKTKTKDEVPILSFVFEERYLTQNVGEIEKSVFQPESPTMSLACLLENGALLDPSEGGQFTAGDKAVLALSLGRCLLHLFHGSWMQKVWTAESIHFLCQSRENEDRIFDIHHPFVTCPLYERKAERHYRPATLLASDCTPFLWGFAKILLEIETGRRFDVEPTQATEQSKLKIWTALQALKTSTRGGELVRYIEAILGCIGFSKALQKTLKDPKYGGLTGSSESHAQDDDTLYSMENVRRVIYDRVIKQLEKHYGMFPENTQVFTGGSLICSRAKPTNGTLEVKTTKIKQFKQSSIYGPIEPLFGFDSHPINQTDTVSLENAKAFSKDFEDFHRRFIQPITKYDITKYGEERPGKGKIDRIKIALLDTGIYEENSDLSTLRSKVIKYRRDQGFQGRDLEPIKKCRSFVQDSVLDSCGHGTQLACLLLEFTPDADIYIAKVSSTMTFTDKKSIVEAIEWATNDMKVDIVTMSFGNPVSSKMIETAIGKSQSAKTNQNHTPILFASASNHGLRGRERSFPASDTRVICGFALDGNGADSSTMNPPIEKGKDHFGTLGVGIRVLWGPEGEVEKYQWKSGTSYATPVLAAIAANYMAWLDVNADALGPPLYQAARTKQGVEKVFRELMDQNKEKGIGISFIIPWRLFQLRGYNIPPPKQPIPDEVARRDRQTAIDCISIIRSTIEPPVE